MNIFDARKQLKRLKRDEKLYHKQNKEFDNPWSESYSYSAYMMDCQIRDEEEIEQHWHEKEQENL